MPQFVEIDGAQVEVFTKGEVEAKAAEAVKPIQTALEAAKAELDKELLKEKNFGKMRQTDSQNQEAIATLKRTVDDLSTNLKDAVAKGIAEVRTKEVETHFQSQLARLAGTDPKLKEQIESQYKRLADVASTPEEVNKKLSDAFTLATGRVPSTGNSHFSSSGAGGPLPQPPAPVGTLTGPAAEVAKKMGYSDDQIKGVKK